LTLRSSSEEADSAAFGTCGNASIGWKQHHFESNV
jgi:hypothetical protein